MTCLCYGDWMDIKRTLWEVLVFLIALIAGTAAFAQGKAYNLTVNNQAVAFTFIDKTCNGGRIDNPPQNLPLGSTQLSVQSDAQQGCMLRYNNGKGSILGIWIHQGQVDCSNQGSIFSYDCTYHKNLSLLNIFSSLNL